MVNKDIVGTPKELRGDVEARKATSKFCDIHNNWGHTTNKCQSLMNKKETLIQIGSFNNLVMGTMQAQSNTMVVAKPI